MIPVAYGASHSVAYDAAVRGGNYLLSVLEEDGSFIYELDVERGASRRGYNILRHAGTVYSLLELYDATGDKEYLRGASSGLSYLREQVESCPGEWGVAGGDGVHPLCVVERGDIKLGGNGLALLAFARYAELTHAEEDLQLMRGLAQWMMDVQVGEGDERGAFSVHKMNTEGYVDDFESLFYPGEAMYGLMRLYRLTNDPAYLDTVRDGVDYLMRVRDDQSVFDLPHDHWLLYAMRELYLVEPEEAIERHVGRYVWAMVLKQNSEEVAPLTDDGAWGARGGIASASTRLEGLGAATTVLSKRGNFPATLERLERAMRHGTAFLLRTQYGADVQGVTNSAFGGWPNSLYDADIRIDMVQHAISALVLHAMWTQAYEQA